MPSPAEEHLIKILKIARERMRDRGVENELFISAVLNEISSLNKEQGTNITAKAASNLELMINDLEDIQFEIEAELGSMVPTEADWGGMSQDQLQQEVK